MNCTIDAIQIESFRGIRRLNLEVDGRNLILVGENGSGKSSVVDALEFFFTGRVDPLEGRGDVDKRNSIPNVRGGSPSVWLKLRGVVPEAGIRLPYPKRRAAIPPALAPICALAEQRSFILRRSQILNFVNARGKERYDAISQMVGLSAIDRIDDCWRSERNAAQARVADLRRERRAVYRRLGELLGAELGSEQDIIEAINGQLTVHTLSPISGREELKVRKQILEQRTRSGVDAARAERLIELEGDLERLVARLDAIGAEYEELERAILQHWARSQVHKDASLERLLREGHRILAEQPDLVACPLCAEPFRDKAALLQDLTDRLDELRGLAESYEQARTLQAGLSESLSGLRHSLESLGRGLESQGMQSQLPAIEELQTEIDRQRDRLKDLDSKLEARIEWHQNQAVVGLRRALPGLKESITAQVESLTPDEMERKALDWLVTVTRVDEQWQILQQKAAELAQAEYVSRQVSLFYDELLAARRRGLERLREELEAEFDHLYQQLHPDEGYEGIAIPVDHGQRSSVALQASFYQQDGAHPLSYYSEGHLDSLGLCIFLAFIKRFNPDLKLIVLDDVLTTVDAGHRLRVARLLAREFGDYQLVITTHDQLWANELRSAIPNPQVVQLRRWTLEGGVDYHDNVLSDWEYYARQAKEGRPQDAIGGAGRCLEKFLYQMRQNLRLAVPARPDGDYTIGDLYGPFWKWVNGHPPQRPDRPDFAEDLEHLNRELDEVWRLRNWSGAHFNAWAETVSTEEALAFVYAIERLVTAFECPVCHTLVVYRRTARALVCPRCQPSPPPQLVYEYRVKWYEALPKVLGASKPQVRQNAVRMSQSIFQAFLQDMRRRLQLEVPATPDDQYGLSELYTPFFEWAAAHSRHGTSDWGRAIAGRKAALDEFWHDGRWAEVPDAEIERFAGTVRQLTTLLECEDCGQLLSYDYERGTYYCTDCSGQETAGSVVPAFWFVRKA